MLLFVDNAKEEIKDILVLTRLLLDDEKPLFTALIHPFLMQRELHIKTNRMIEEKRKLEAEIEEISSRDKLKIQELQKKIDDKSV